MGGPGKKLGTTRKAIGGKVFHAKKGKKEEWGNWEGGKQKGERQRERKGRIMRGGGGGKENIIITQVTLERVEERVKHRRGDRQGGQPGRKKTGKLKTMKLGFFP